MTDFLSNRLLSAKRFSIKDRRDAHEGATSSSDGETEPAPETAEELSRLEQRAAADHAFRSTAVELSRQRREMLIRLREHAHALEHEQDRLTAHLETVGRLQEGLETLPEDLAGDDPTAVRELRRAVEAARLELAREARQEAERVASSHGSGVTELASLGFGRLVRLSLAASLPLILAVLLAAVIIAFALSAAFGL